MSSEHDAALLEMLFGNAPFGLAVLNRELRFVRVNAVLAEMNGRTVSDHIGRRLSEVVPGLPIERIEGDLQCILETGEPMLNVGVSGETPASPGVRRHWMVDWYPLRNGPDTVGVGAVVREVTAQREAESAVRRQADLIALSHDAIVTWQLDGGAIESWNRGAVELYGYSEHEALGRNVDELLGTRYPVPKVEVEAALRRAWRWDGEVAHGTRPGRDVTVSARMQLVRGIDGVQRVLATNRDVTEQKRAEQHLTYLASFPTESPHAIIELDDRNHVRYANPAALGLFPALEQGHGLPAALDAWGMVARSVRAGEGARTRDLEVAGRTYRLTVLPLPDGGRRIYTLDVTDHTHASAMLRALIARLDAVREEEKKRIARDLHDEMGQVLTALTLELEGLEERVEDLDARHPVPQLLDRAVAASELAAKATRSLHELVTLLRPAALDRLGLIAALRQECRRFQDHAKVACDFLSSDVAPSLAPDVETALFRIAQEALTNVARHAAASRAVVEVEVSAIDVVLRISDDGRGLPPPSTRCARLGLVGMRERAERLGGSLSVAAGPLGGTSVSACIPIAGARVAPAAVKAEA
ncbi:MAG TPA: PAS domain-containing protein [Anaeromyxobacteraceae bacterium]|nr:PAS domain-containing protein [Anaeromyxobacteraceae bacterium]